MRIIVTGATGFVGRALIARLCRDGHAVTATVRRAIELPVPTHVVGNIDRATDWADALRGVECVIHLAARVHQMEERSADALSVYRATNTAGTLHLAQAAADAGVRRLVFLSTAKVLGESSATEGFSDSSTPSPQDPYSISKWEAELGLQDLARTSGLEVCVLRPPLVYGPGVRANFLRLLRWVDRSYPLPFGAIRNRRSLIALENLVDAIAICATHPNAAGRAFLVSDGEAVSTPALIRLLAEELGRPARLVPVPLGMLRVLGRITRHLAEIDRLTGDFLVHDDGIKTALDWRPSRTMREAIAQTVGWYRLRGTE